MKIVDDENNELPWDGKRFGRLKVAGPAVAKAYFKDEGGDILDDNGFFDTGDVATIDPDGYMQITDRAKDVIKSGGEWISSIDIENLAVGHPDVAEAAVIGVAHPKWDERPLLVVVPKEGKHAEAGRSARLSRRPNRQVVDARRHAGGDGNPPHGHRQDQQAEAARGVQGLQAADRLNRRRLVSAGGGRAEIGDRFSGRGAGRSRPRQNPPPAVAIASDWRAPRVTTEASSRETLAARGEFEPAGAAGAGDAALDLAREFPPVAEDRAVGLVERDAEGERLPRVGAVERLVEVVAAAADGVTRAAVQRRRRAVAELRRAFAAPGALEPGEDFAGLGERRARRRREQERDDRKSRRA